MGLFEQYKNHPDKAVRERANNWGAAIGLQNVDGLSVSELLIQLARQQIEGKITIEEVTQRLNEHYKHRKLYNSTYEIVPPNSEMIKRMKEENELRRPEMYKENRTILYCQIVRFAIVIIFCICVHYKVHHFNRWLKWSFNRGLIFTTK